MKKIIIACIAIVAIAAGSCKKEEIAQPAKLSLKPVADIKEHTGWDRGDSTETGENP